MMQSATSASSSSWECVVPPLLSSVLQESSRNFDCMRTQLNAINHSQLQEHIQAVSALAPSAVLDKIGTLEKWVLQLAFDEAREMEQGRMLNALGPPPPAVAEILAQLPSQPHVADSASAQPGSRPDEGAKSMHLLSTHTRATDAVSATQPSINDAATAAASNDSSAAPMVME